MRLLNRDMTVVFSVAGVLRTIVVGGAASLAAARYNFVTAFSLKSKVGMRCKLTLRDENHAEAYIIVPVVGFVAVTIRGPTTHGFGIPATASNNT